MGNRPARVLSSGGGDLVDEPVVERFPGVKVAPAPHVLGDLLGRAARDLGEASVEPPEQLLLLATVRGDLVWRPGELRRWLEEPKACVWGGRAVIGGRGDTNGRTTDLSAAMCGSLARSGSRVSMRTKAASSVPSGLSRWSSMGSSPMASKVMRAAAASAARSASSRPVTNTIRRSNNFSCNQAESRRRLEGS